MSTDNDTPPCYGYWANQHEECVECAIENNCKMATIRPKPGIPKKKSRTAGLSMRRAINAFCWECLGALSVGDCKAPACPLYAFRKKNTNKPNLWWMEPHSDWSHLAQKARLLLEDNKDNKSE